MKKTLLSAAVLFAAMTANAQTPITITQSDMPVAGMSPIQANDTLFTGISVGSSGPNQTWNLTTINSDYLDTTLIVAASGTPGFSSFPTANLASTTPDGSQNSFFNLSQNSLDILGIYANFDGLTGMTAMPFNPPIKHINLPATYNMTPYLGTSDFHLKFAYPPGSGIDSIRVDFTQTYTNTIDGWGTLTTPSYASVPVLRLNTYTIEQNAMFMKPTGGTAWVPAGQPGIDTTTTYSWWSNLVKHPLAEVDVENDGTVKSAKYLTTGTVGIHETAATQNNLSVYPNPATENITIAGVTEMSVIVISDVTGKLVSSELLQNNRTTINISHFENGIYFYQVGNSKGNTIGKGKFVVAK